MDFDVRKIILTSLNTPLVDGCNRYNQSLRLAERYLEFDVAGLQKIAAHAVSREEHEVKHIRKLAEGGYNRIFEVTLDGDFKVLARIPYPTTLPKRYAVASEVATIDFLRSHGMPVPRIYDYAVTGNNVIGSEYIIMEHMPGVEVGHRWFELSTSERKTITLEITKLENILLSISLPANGSIYYKRDSVSTDKRIDIPGHDDFCIGPIAALSWWFDGRDTLNINRGPFERASEVMTAGAQKELAWLHQFGRPRYPFDRHHRDILGYQKSDPADHIKSLEKYLRICSQLTPRTKTLLRPVIRHPDLQPHNIFVSDDFKITGLIDWQHCSVLPLFLLAGVPKYWQNVTDGPTVIEKPTLPPNYEELDETDKAQAMDDFRQRQVHMLYLGGTSKFNGQHMDAYLTPGVPFIARLYNKAVSPWEGNNVFLKADLILAARNWTDLTRNSESSHVVGCPYSFDMQEAEDCLRLQTTLTQRDAEMESVRQGIGIGSDGWLPNEDYDSVVKKNALIKQKVIDEAEDEAMKALSLAHYPFDDFDEEE